VSVKSRLNEEKINCRHDLKMSKSLAKDIRDALDLENKDRRLNNEGEVKKNSFICELLDNAISMYWIFEQL